MWALPRVYRPSAARPGLRLKQKSRGNDGIGHSRPVQTVALPARSTQVTRCSGRRTDRWRWGAFVVRPDRLTLGAFAVVVVIGGVVPVAIRLGGFELPPLWAAGLRFGIGAMILGGLAIAAHAPFPRGAHLLGVVLFGLLLFGVSISLLYLGLIEAPAAVASIAGAFGPLATLLLAAAIGLERLTLRGLGGSLVAAAGIAAIVVDQLGAAVPLLALTALGGSTLAFAAALVSLKRLPLGDPKAGLAVGMAIGAPILLGLSAVNHEPWALPARNDTWVSFVFLVLVATVLNFRLGYFVVERWTASAFSYLGLISPLVTVLVAAIILAEPIRPTTIVGGALIVGGTWLGAFSAPSVESPGSVPVEA
jgi:drug/metabolite transporter (DMT)-like permease